MNTALFVLVVSLLSASSPAFAASAPSPRSSSVQIKTIYGQDTREDLYQVQDPRILQAADSSVALFVGASLTQGPAGASYYNLRTGVLGKDYGLCTDQRFWDQPIGAFCSGSLVAPDLVMTAGHCVTDADGCQMAKIVFGFSIYREGTYPTAVPAKDVYSCKEIVGRAQADPGADWALIRLDRPVMDHRPLAINRAGGIANGTPLFVIGHPSGLPTKVAAGAIVRDASPNGYFVGNTDTFGGNSGSPVFNQNTGLIEGILVRGDGDYIDDPDRNCSVVNVCLPDGCRGEDSTKVGVLASLIPTPASRTSKVSTRVASVRSALLLDGLLKSARTDAAALNAQ